jgi:hypothetical protein
MLQRAGWQVFECMVVEGVNESYMLWQSRSVTYELFQLWEISILEFRRELEERSKILSKIGPETFKTMLFKM